MALVNAGYMGWLNVGGNPLRMTSSSLVIKQEAITPELMGGSPDYLAWYHGKIEMGGNVAGPVDSNFAAQIWPWATARDSCGIMSNNEQVTVYYYCDNPAGGNEGMTFPQMLVNQLTISCSAGDVAQFSLDLVGSVPPGSGTYNPYVSYTQTSLSTTDAKLLTWDKVAASITNYGASNGTLTTEYLSNFEISISNNITPQYSLGSGSLYPFALVTGMRTITGSFSVYNINGPLGRDTWDADVTHGIVQFSLGGTTYSIKCQFNRITPAGQVGPIISTIAFKGQGQQSL